jgi:uncharacterized protein
MEKTISSRGGNRHERNLSWWQFLALAVVYLAIIQLGSLIIGSGIAHADATETTHNLLLKTVIPIALSTLFAVTLATWLGWWKQIIFEDLRVQPWVRIIPIIMVGAALIATDWGNLFDQKTSLVLTLVLMVALVGFTEELMFRGIGLLAFRRAGFSEGRVALYSSLAFGAAHLSNALTTGASAILQALVVSFAGYFFYLIRRRAGLIFAPMLVHSIWDFGLLSSDLGVDTEGYPLGFVAVLAMIVLAILVWRRRHRIEPEPGVA